MSSMAHNVGSIPFPVLENVRPLDWVFSDFIAWSFGLSWIGGTRTSVMVHMDCDMMEFLSASFVVPTFDS